MDQPETSLPVGTSGAADDPDDGRAEQTRPVLLLAPAQVNYFHDFGFLHLPGFLGDDLPVVLRAFDEVFAEHEGTETSGPLHLGGSYRVQPFMLELHPDLIGLKEDPRVLGVVRSLISGQIEYRASVGNVYACDTSWHCDRYGSPLDQFHIKLLFYLDPADADTGALRVLPGTNHYQGTYAADMRRELLHWSAIEPRYGIEPQQVPSYVVPSRPGDLIVLNFRTLHATFGGRPGRRLITLDFRDVARPS